MFCFSFLGGHTSVCLVWWLATAGWSARAWEASPFCQRMCAWVGEHFNIQAISGLPRLLFPAPPSCISVLVRDVGGELGPLCPSLPGHAASQSVGVVGTVYPVLPLFFLFPHLLVKFVANPLIFHSPQTPLWCQARELCGFSICFLPTVFISLVTLLGVSRCPWLQTRCVLSGISPAAFHSQPHPGRTAVPASCVQGDVNNSRIGCSLLLSYLSNISFS